MRTEVVVCDMFKLALLDLIGVTPKKVEYHKRYEATFASEDVERVLQQYDAGRYQVDARAFVDAITRTKNRIFDARRAVEIVARQNTPVKW